MIKQTSKNTLINNLDNKKTAFNKDVTNNETDFLLKNPNNAQILKRSIADAKAGKLTKHELIEIV